jgi:hypothetical protein
MKYFLLGCILILCVASLLIQREGFGMSPGTLTQLQSTSAPMGQYLVY